MAGREIVYVLTNPSMPGLVKIGKTTQIDLSARLSALHDRRAGPL